MVADDLHLTSGSAGQTIGTLSFAVANLNSIAVNANAEIGLWEDDGLGGTPGTLIAGSVQALGPATFATGDVNICTIDLSAEDLTVPADGVLWAGVFFDNGGATATPSQLSLLGLSLCDPPTVGGSADLFFQSGGGFSPASNPAGGEYFFGGGPVANFGFAVQAAPEPSILALGALSSLGILMARRMCLPKINRPGASAVKI